MLMAIITEKGLTIDFGTPTMFVDDNTFSEFLEDPSKAIEFRNIMGKNICVGRLGQKNEVGVYCEKAIEDKTLNFDDNVKGGSFYGYV